jgi:anaerobic selenocysteine-containing dehydrogenase
VPSFSTEGGKAKFTVVPIPELKRSAGEFTLCSVRSEGQFNTIVYEEEDIYRGTESRWVVMMNRDDMSKLDITERDYVNITTQTGSMSTVAVKTFEIAPGNVAAFFPEANVLIPNTVDEQSKTPGFKSVAVKISKE